MKKTQENIYKLADIIVKSFSYQELESYAHSGTVNELTDMTDEDFKERSEDYGL